MPTTAGWYTTMSTAPLENSFLRPNSGLTSPKIGHTMWYYFKFDEKIIRSLNNLSRNIEFHQPEC